MIDFQNGAVIKLHEDKNEKIPAFVAAILIDGEEVLTLFRSVRDMVIFTSKRMITMNVQGVTGKKKDITCLPYKRIQAFSVETAGVMELDSEMTLWFSGLGKVRLEFSAYSDVAAICKMISRETLN